jgi:hypothetical protein
LVFWVWKQTIWQPCYQEWLPSSIFAIFKTSPM